MYVNEYRVYEYPREPMTVLIWKGLTACIIKCINPDKLLHLDWKYCIECAGVRYEVTDRELNESCQDYGLELTYEYDWTKKVK
jgi:hypothetical protein